MVYFVGAGCGAADLITVRGMRLLERADVIIYTGSLVNPQLLSHAKKDCEIHNSAKLTLEEVIQRISGAEAEGKMTVRLHTEHLYGNYTGGHWYGTCKLFDEGCREGNQRSRHFIRSRENVKNRLF